MTAETPNWVAAPVQAAHSAIQANGSVASVLNNAPVPDSVPSISSGAVSSGGWARFVGMVQDIWDAELFVATSNTSESCLLVEGGCSSESGIKLSERLPVYLVSLPGATAWTRSGPSSAGNGSNSHNRKRSREPSSERDCTGTTGVTGPISSGTTPIANDSSRMAVTSTVPEKRKRSGSSTTSDPKFFGLGLNHPDSGTGVAGCAVLAKVYENNSELSLKVNTMVEVVGILQYAVPEAMNGTGNSDAHDKAFEEESIARNPQNVPRLHAVRVRVLKSWEINPVVSSSIASYGVSKVRSDLLIALPTLRQDLIMFLASALFGDVLAAEYLLMALISRPVSRTSAGGTIGNLSINIVMPSETEAENQTGSTRGANLLIRTLQSVLPSVVTLAVNIASLNARELFPRKDYTANRLRAAPLQLPAGSCLVANETELCDGRLAARGVKNVRALEAIAKRCAVPADFEYYESDLPTDNCSVFISRGSKSIIKTDIHVRVVPNANFDGKLLDSCPPDTLNKLRLGLGMLVEDGVFDIPTTVSAAVESHFVKARTFGKAADGQETLMRWLSVARASARTFGERALSVERWEYAMGLEARREAQCAQRKVQ